MGILDRRELIMAAEIAAEKLHNILMDENPEENKNRHSGYLTLMNATNGRILLVVQIGNCPQTKARKYFDFSQEKAGRLFIHPDHSSSWQSRIPETNQWGGAIRTTNDLILSFSGLPELADEALGLWVAFKMEWMDVADAVVLATISENRYFSQLVAE